MQDLFALPPYERVRRVTPTLIQVFFGLPACRVLSLLLLFAAASSTLLGQQFATLNLTVADPAGRVIAQASVSVRNVDTGVIRTVSSCCWPCHASPVHCSCFCCHDTFHPHRPPLFRTRCLPRRRLTEDSWRRAMKQPRWIDVLPG